jgi:hypothetical protein
MKEKTSLPNISYACSVASHHGAHHKFARSKNIERVVHSFRRELFLLTSYSIPAFYIAFISEKLKIHSKKFWLYKMSKCRREGLLSHPNVARW